MASNLRIWMTAAAIAAVVAGCGDDDEATTGAADTTTATSTETSPEPLSKKDYLEQADAICLRVNEEIQGIQSFPEEGPPIIEGGLAELRALPAPEGEEEQLDEVYTAGDDALGTLEGATEPPQGDPFKEFTQLADDYGFEGGCTRNEG